MSRLRFAAVFTALTTLVLISAPAIADDNAWTGATNFNWSTVAGNNNWALPPSYWANVFIDGAFFNGAAPGTITATTPITLRGMSFNANGYTINGSSLNPLTLTAGAAGSLQNGEIQVGNGFTGTVNAVLAGTVGLTKTGAGTLLLGGANTYSGGTNINAGTLTVTAGGAILPRGGNVTVASGATFNFGNGASITNGGAALGTLTLNNGTYRLSGGAGDFYLNQLVIGSSGGTLNLTGATDFWTHFTGAGAGITVNGNSTWTGSGTSHIQNDSGALLPITVNGTVSSSVTMVGTGTAGYRLLGGSGTFILNNPTSANTADFRVEANYLQVADMAYLGSGAITLAGSVISAGNVDTLARLEYTGATTTSAKPLTLDASGGDIWVTNTGTNLTLTGVIGETGGTGRALTVYGDFANGTVLTLTAANTYTGPTAVNYGGILSIATIANGDVPSPIGASSSAASNLILGGGNFGGTGTLRYSGLTADTDRGLTLGSAGGTIDVTTANAVLTFDGQFTGAGALTKTGSGRMTLSNASNNYTGGTTVLNGYLTVPDVAALGSGSLTLNGGILAGSESLARWEYTGPTASTARPTILNGTGGDIWVLDPTATLTLSGIISETGGTGRALTVYGGDLANGAVLALTAANTFTGPTVVNYRGTLSIPTIANGGVASPIGAASNAPANIQLGGGNFGGDGTLRYTGPTASTDRGVTLESASYNSTIDVATAATTLTMSGQFTGAGALTKAGAGTLVLTNPANNYANGTIINAGTLAVAGGGPVLPVGKNVTVNGGATFNYGNGVSISNSGSPIATLTLNNGTYRVSGGSGDFYLNQFVIGNTGGTLDFTGASTFWTHFTGAGAGITVNSDSIWTGASSSRIQNDSGTILPFTIGIGFTVTSSVEFVNNTAGYRLLGNGTLFLSNPTSTNTADFRVEAANLRVADMTHLGTGAITLAGSIISAGNTDTSARLWYSGATASSAKALTLDASGGDIIVSTTGTTLTLSGVINEIGGTGRALTVYGDGGSGSVLSLTAANTYTGPTAVNQGGILSIPTFANGGVASPLGASSNAPANVRLGGGSFGGDGTLRYTGATTSTDRGVTLPSAAYNSTIDVATAGTVLTMTGQFTGAGALSKAGAGTLLLTNNINNYASGTVVNAGTLAIGNGGAVLPAGENVTVNGGATFNYGNGASFNNSGAAIGTLTLNNGTYRLTGGAGDFYLNQLVIGNTGGTLDFTGATDYWTHFTGASAGITVNNSSNWTGSGTSHIQNDTGALLPITINNGTVTTSVTMVGSGTSGYRLLGGSTFFLSNPTSINTADFRVEAEYLRVADMTHLGSGAITLAGAPISAGFVDTLARLWYSGPSATSAKPLTLDASGGDIYVSNTGTNLTLTGVISETGGTGRALTVYGDLGNGTVLTLTAANTYTGPTAVNYGGILSIATFPNGGAASPIGASSNAPANLQLGGGFFGGTGTLRYTGPTIATDRGVTLASNFYSGAIDVATAGTVLTMSGQFTGTGALTKAGAGTLVLNNSTNNYANGTNVNAGTLTVAVGGSMPGGVVTVASGATLNVNGSIASTATVNDNGTTNFAGNTSVVVPLSRPLTALNIGNAALATVNLSASTLFPEILSPATFTVTGTGKLDLTNNEMTTTSTPAAMRTILAAGSVFSSHANPNTALGYMDIGSGSTEVRYTLKGDANLDGSVGVGDLGALATSYNTAAGAIWSQGDFNYDGAVGVGDLGALATNYGTSLVAGSSTDSVVASPQAIASSVSEPNLAIVAGPQATPTSVPEPTTLAMLGLAAIPLLSRRRMVR